MESPAVLRKTMALITETSSRLPKYGRDRTDRNRTSPFAFTGNKFEFRAVGSSQNVAVPVTALNCALACALEEMTAVVDSKVKGGTAQDTAIKQMVIETLTKHYRVLFNGDGYSAEWVTEAAKRGLPNFRSTPKALLGANMVDIYTRTKTMSEPECNARKEVILENYVKAKQIEARCLAQMCTKHFAPAAHQALARIGAAQAVVKNAEVEKQVAELSGLLGTLLGEHAKLKKHLQHSGDVAEEATYIDDQVCPTMDAIRVAADAIEDLCTVEEWNLPTYHELLFIQCP